jgi:hypothetical protein
MSGSTRALNYSMAHMDMEDTEKKTHTHTHIQRKRHTQKEREREQLPNTANSKGKCN